MAINYLRKSCADFAANPYAPHIVAAIVVIALAVLIPLGFAHQEEVKQFFHNIFSKVDEHSQQAFIFCVVSAALFLAILLGIKKIAQRYFCQ